MALPVFNTIHESVLFLFLGLLEDLGGWRVVFLERLKMIHVILKRGAAGEIRGGCVNLVAKECLYSLEGGFVGK